MKKLMIAALLAGQLLGTGVPALGQSQASVRGTEAGTFAGLRVRLSFGGANPEPLRAGLAFAPTQRIDYQDGHVRTRIGEGLEFGMVGRAPLQFSLAGTPVSRLAQGRTGPDGRRMGVSTLGWVAIGVVATAVIVVSAAAICISDHDCLPDE